VRKQKRTKKKRQNDFLFLLRHVKFSWFFIILAVIATVTGTSLASKIPDATAQLFDGNFQMSRLWDVITMGLLTTGIGLVSFTFRLIAETRSTLAARNCAWEYMITTRSEYYDKHDSGSLLSLVTVDAQTLANGLVQMFIFIPQLVTMFGMSALMLAGYSVKLLPIVGFIIIINIIYMYFVGRWQQKIGKGFSTEIGNLTGYLAERIRNLTMIKSFVAEKKEYERGIEVSGKLYGVGKRYTWLGVVMGSFASVSGAIGTVVTVLWGSFLLRRGEIDVPAFLGFNMYVGLVNVAMVLISIVWTFIKDFQGRAYRLARLIEAPREEFDKDKSATEIPDGDIEIRGVSFTYPNQENSVLTDISFTAPRGKVTAIVGPSGSGKTTLVKLLERLYLPTSGVITIGDVDINSLNLKAWRGKLAYVVQDAGIFGGTLREAICYGSNGDVPEERLMQIVEQVGLVDFVKSLPKKLDTVLGSWGGTISGGQRQRIVIARALLQNADILIFDEPTSALDPETANVISEMILEKFRDKTIIVISHELNYIAAADNIVVINNGKIEANGEHPFLMTNCGVYRELVEEQSYREVFGV
jgi:ATP-binding cassette subfamily B protein AbcA/BmrA